MEENNLSWDEIFQSYARKATQTPKKINFPEKLDARPVVSTSKSDQKKRKRPQTVFSPTTASYRKESEYVIPPELPIKNLEDLENRAGEDDIFYRRLCELDKLAAKTDSVVYDQSQAFAYINSLEKNESAPLWYRQAQEVTLEHGKRYPVIPVYARKYLTEFMRAPRGDEKPCGRNDCTSVKMGGFRCREFYPVGGPQTKNPAWCIMCHFCVTNELYLEGLNRPSNEEDETKIYLIHHFMVKTDIIGEYRLEKTLQGEKMMRGLYGPFPVFNVNNYVQDGHSWKEVDAMLFRLPQKVSAQTGCSPTIKLEGEKH